MKPTFRGMGIRAPAIVALAALVAVSCAKVPGQFVWVDDYLPPPEAEYEIASGDTLQVRVYREDALSARVRVRTDGKVSLPLLYDVPASGRTLTQLSRDIEERLKTVVNKPVVTVSLEEARPRQFSVIGEVARPGTYALEAGLGVLQALANAGGIGEFANRDRIFVLRQGTSRDRIRFTYEALSRAEGQSASFTLRSGDVIVVE